MCAGQHALLQNFHTSSLRSMILKGRALLGCDEGDDKNVSILNRFIALAIINGERIVTDEPDPRHVDLLVTRVGLAPSTRVSW